MIRKQASTVLIMISATLWGIWCGGQYFNEARVIPKLLSNPPESIVAYNQIPTSGNLPFFFPLNPLVFLISFAAAVAAWKYARKTRKWLALTTFIGFGICLILVLYLAPLIGSISSDAGNLPADEIINRAEAWRFGNRIRLVVDITGFVCSLVALRVWSAEIKD